MGNVMKEVVYRKYGSPDVLKIESALVPIPEDDEFLVEVHATTVTTADVRIRSLNVPVGFGFVSRLVFGIFKPRNPILGTELSGVVVKTGRNVRKFNVGDKVFAFSGFMMGAYRQYKCFRENHIVLIKPPNLNYCEAAALSFGGTTALYFLRLAKVKKGDNVLINGASSCVGSAAVQIARYFGAEVTGVCSTDNVDLVRSIGANRVIDYTKENFLDAGIKYDVVLDVVGSLPIKSYRAALNTKGCLILAQPSLLELLMIPWVSIRYGVRIVSGPAPECIEDVAYLAGLAREGHMKPVMDRSYKLGEIAEAHRYVDTRRKKGNVCIRFQEL